MMQEVMKRLGLVAALLLPILDENAESLGRIGTTSEVEIVVPTQRTTFLPGEPVVIEVILHNRSSEPIVEPVLSDWHITIADATGAALRDTAVLHRPRFWIRPESGTSVDPPTIQPGGSQEWSFQLRNRFRLSAEGAYTAEFSVDYAHVVGDASGGTHVGPFETVEATPIAFELSSADVIWQQSAGPLVFHVVNDGAGLSLRFYRGPLTDADEQLFTDYTVVGAVSALEPAPKVSESPDVTERNGRAGIKFLSAEGLVCAVVAISENIVTFVPPFPIDATSKCPDT